MALTELNQQTRENGAVKPAKPSLKVTVRAETSASPEQVLAAAYDFSERRAQIWRDVEVKHLTVHERGDAWAEVTEDCSEPGTVTASVLDSNVFRPGSTLELRAVPREGRGSEVEMIITHNFRNGVKGTTARSINHLAGRRVSGWYLRTTLAEIEKTSADGSATNPGQPTR
jgi:hypothetical protein